MTCEEELRNKIEKLEKENHELKLLYTETEKLAELGSYKINLDTGVADWSAGVYEIFDISKSDELLTPQGYYDLIHPDDREAVKRLFNECNIHNAPFDLKYRIISKNNAIKNVHSKAEVINNDNGERILFGFFKDITKESRFQQSITEKNEKMKLAFEAGNMSWWGMHLPSGSVDFGENKVKMLGRTPEGFNTYKDFMSIVHPDDFDHTMQAMRDHLNGKNELYKTDYRIKANDGKYYWYRDFGRIIEKNNTGLRLLGIVENIHNIKELQSKLNQSEKQKQLIIESSTELISYYNPDLTIVWTNKEGSGHIKKSTNELVGRKCYEVWHNADEPYKDCPVVKTRDTLLPHESQIETTDGRILHVRSFPVFDNNNKLIGLSEFGLDITERKKKNLIIEESEKKYKHLVENAPFGIVVFSKEKTVFANQFLSKLLGAKTPEIIYKNNFINYIHKEDRNRFEKILETSIDNAPNKGNFFRVSLSKGHTKLQAEILMTPIHSSDSLLWQCIVIDISKEIKIENKAKRLSTDALYISRKLKLFSDIKQELEEIITKNAFPHSPFQNILNHINSEINLEELWKIFQNNFEVVYDDFFKKLLHRAPNLTQQELKHCAFIKMNFETKEIATMFNVKPTSVQISRVRMKKKLKLNSDQELVHFIFTL